MISFTRQRVKFDVRPIPILSFLINSLDHFLPRSFFPAGESYANGSSNSNLIKYAVPIFQLTAADIKNNFISKTKMIFDNMQKKNRHRLKLNYQSKI